MLICASAVKRPAINEAAAAKSPEQWPPITRINYESKLVVFCHPSYNGTGPHGSLYQVEKLDVFILHGSTERMQCPNRGSSLTLRVWFSKLSCRQLRQAGTQREGCFNMGACPMLPGRGAVPRIDVVILEASARVDPILR
jgi:hypothetical protein